MAKYDPKQDKSFKEYEEDFQNLKRNFVKKYGKNNVAVKYVVNEEKYAVIQIRKGNLEIQVFDGKRKNGWQIGEGHSTFWNGYCKYTYKNRLPLILNHYKQKSKIKPIEINFKTRGSSEKLDLSKI